MIVDCELGYYCFVEEDICFVKLSNFLCLIGYYCLKGIVNLVGCKLGLY